MTVPDLSTGGMTLPLLVAAAVAGALHWYTSRKPPTPAPAPNAAPAPEAGPLDWLAGLIAKTKYLQALGPVLLAIWNNHEKILAALQAFISSVKQMANPQPPKQGA